MARAAASRWTHRLVGGAFDAWLDATLKSRLSLELARRAISRLTLRTQARAFEAWVRNARFSRLRTKRFEAVARRWFLRDARKAYTPPRSSRNRNSRIQTFGGGIS